MGASAKHSRPTNGNQRGERAGPKSSGESARSSHDGKGKHSRPSPLVAGADDDWAGAASRKNDALLARPFCDQRTKSQKRLLDVAAKRHTAPQRLGKFRHARQKNVTRPGDDDLPRSSPEPQGASK